MKGICQISLIPCRAEDSDRSEMVNQLLFGETYSVLEEKEKWIKIISDEDQYECWISRNQHSELSKPSEKRCVVNGKILEAISENEHLLLPAGSFVDEQHQTHVNGSTYIFENAIESIDNGNIERLAKSFLNTPYLWGGKSFMGIDCSGFTQVVFRCVGLHLPRDAWQQEKEGEAVKIGEEKKGDLAFFANEQKKITHVGIVLNEKEIIHASGKVRIDIFDPHGIVHSETGVRTHQLFSLKRYF